MEQHFQEIKPIMTVFTLIQTSSLKTERTQKLVEHA